MTKADNNPDTIPPIQYATFNSRIIATTVDLFIIMPFAIPLIGWLTDIVYGPMNLNEITAMLNQPEILQNPGKAVPVLFDMGRKYHMVGRTILENILQCVAIATYMLPFWFRYSSTPGKMLLRLEIQDAVTGARITRKQAIERFLGYIVSFAPLTLGFLWILLNKKRQGFHDKMAGTIVVIRPRKPNSAAI